LSPRKSLSIAMFSSSVFFEFNKNNDEEKKFKEIIQTDNLNCKKT